VKPLDRRRQLLEDERGEDSRRTQNSEDEIISRNGRRIVHVQQISDVQPWLLENQSAQTVVKLLGMRPPAPPEKYKSFIEFL
jgi:hypothetical protein